MREKFEKSKVLDGGDQGTKGGERGKSIQRI